MDSLVDSYLHSAGPALFLLEEDQIILSQPTLLYLDMFNDERSTSRGKNASVVVTRPCIPDNKSEKRKMLKNGSKDINVTLKQSTVNFSSTQVAKEANVEGSN
jgi:hypothetical protein